jgi:hypothetical protein
LRIEDGRSLAPIRYLQIGSVASMRAYAIVRAGWVLDGKPTAGSQKFVFEQAQRDIGLKEPPRPEQVCVFSLLDELGSDEWFRCRGNFL